MNAFFELLQLAIGTSSCYDRMCLSYTPTPSEWQEIYNMAEQQAVIGICFAGVEKLPFEQRPPMELLVNWFGTAEYVKHSNEEMNRRCVEIFDECIGAGFSPCLLKGQGVAELYQDLSSLRLCGDIDIWLDIDRKKVIKFVKQQINDLEARVHHVKYKCVDGISIELHFLPTYMYSFRTHRRLVSYCRKKWKQQTENGIRLGGLEPEISVPVVEFDAVFMLVHILRHLFEEGVGLKQVLDYYFVLKAFNNLSGAVKSETRQFIFSLGMNRFGSALMWVLGHCLLMPEEWMIIEPDEKRGRLLLGEIMRTGNMGYFDKTKGEQMKVSRVAMFLWKLKRNSRIFSLCPEEFIAGPVFRIWHYFWRLRNEYMAENEQRLFYFR